MTIEWMDFRLLKETDTHKSGIILTVPGNNHPRAKCYFLKSTPL